MDKDLHSKNVAILEYTQFKVRSTSKSKEYIHNKKHFNKAKKETTPDIITPTIYFKSDNFLWENYKIKSFDDSINILTIDNSMNYYSIERILNNSWKAYGLELKDFSSDLINYHINFISNNWEKYIIKKTNVKKNINDIISNEFMIAFFSYYIMKHKTEWYHIFSHLDQMKEDFWIYLKKSMKIKK